MMRQELSSGHGQAPVAKQLGRSSRGQRALPLSTELIPVGGGATGP